MKVPKWPSKAIGAIRELFRSLQDIEVFVEDEGSEAFYGELFRRAAPSGVKIHRVFPLNGRDNVIAAAKTHDFRSRRALFLIDGDFNWVRGERPVEIDGLYRLEAYCIENLLVCKTAATRILMESEAISETDAEALLEFDEWVVSLAHLPLLFAHWSVLNHLSPDEPTVSKGIGCVLDEGEVDPEKIKLLTNRSKELLSNIPGGEALCEQATRRVLALARPIDAVSGKDFVLPALDLHLRTKTKEKARRKSLKFRLALHVAAPQLAGLSDAIVKAARGDNRHYQSEL